MQGLRNNSSHREKLFSFTSVFEILHMRENFSMVFMWSSVTTFCQRNHRKYYHVLHRYVNIRANKESPFAVYSV